jgi:hypothetical protein
VPKTLSRLSITGLMPSPTSRTSALQEPSLDHIDIRDNLVVVVYIYVHCQFGMLTLTSMVGRHNDSGIRYKDYTICRCTGVMELWWGLHHASTLLGSEDVREHVADRQSRGCG